MENFFSFFLLTNQCDQSVVTIFSRGCALSHRFLGAQPEKRALGFAMWFVYWFSPNLYPIRPTDDIVASHQTSMEAAKWVEGCREAKNRQIFKLFTWIVRQHYVDGKWLRSKLCACECFTCIVSKLSERLKNTNPLNKYYNCMMSWV